MGEGFKLLDAYVEVTASGKGLAEKVASDVQREGAGHLTSAGSSMGTSLLGGFKGVLGAGVVGGIVSTFGYAVSNQVQNVVGSAFGFAKGAVVDFNSQLENSTIGFTTMLGSAQKAQVFLNQLQDFAKSTPFEFGDLVSNAQQMMGMGIAAKDVIPDLTALGDSVASIGGSASQVNSVTLAFDQMAAKGTLDMGNMNQLMQNGVPSALKILAASYKVTTGDMINMISTGKVQSSVALPALVKGLENGTKATAALGGMMDKQSGTMTGALSNIADGLNQSIAKGFRPFFKILEEGSVKLAAFVSTKQFANFISGVGAAMTGGLRKVQDFIGGVQAIFSPAHSPAIKVGGWLRQMSQLPKPHNPFAGFIDSITKSSKNIPDDIKKAFTSLESSAKKALPNLITFGQQTAPRLITLFDKLIKVTPKVGEALGKLSPVLGAVGYVFNNFIDKAITPTVNKVSDMLDIFNGKKNAVKTSYTDALTGKLGADWQILGTVVGGVAYAVGFAIGWVHRSLDDGWKQISGFVTNAANLYTQMNDAGKNLVQGLVNGITGAASTVMDAVNTVIGSIPAVVRKFLGIASPSKVFHLIGTQVGQGLHLGLLGSVDQIKATSTKLADAVKAGFSGSLETSMVARIQSVSKALETLSSRRASAQSALASTIANSAQYGAGVKSNLMGNADVTSLYGASATTTGAGLSTLNGVAYQPSWSSSSAAGLGGVKASLTKLLTDTRRFTGNLGKLAKMGIDPGTYDQLVQAGVTGGGLTTSDAFLADPAGFRQIVSLEKQIGRAGNTLGNTAAAHQYGARIKGLQQEVHNYNIAMTIDARKIDDLAKLVRTVERLKQTARAK